MLSVAKADDDLSAQPKLIERLEAKGIKHTAVIYADPCARFLSEGKFRIRTNLRRGRGLDQHAARHQLLGPMWLLLN